MIPDHLHRDHCGRHLRTRPLLATLAPEITAQRCSGVTVRAIALSLGASRSGVYGLLVRLGLAGTCPARCARPLVLDRRACEAVALLTHPHARRLTWRQRLALQGCVRGMTTTAIATNLGISATGVRSLIATARRRVERSWRRRSRARRRQPIDLTTWDALVPRWQLARKKSSND